MALWSNSDTLAAKPKYLTKLNTLDATSTDVVNTADDELVVPAHSFLTGDAVAYEASGDAIGGLTDGTTYYVIRVDENTIQLAASAADAGTGTAIDLTAVGTGDADTLQLTAPTVVFVDDSEATVPANRAKGITGPGWWIYRTYTADTVTRHKAECLVALAQSAALAGDSEDTITVDNSITISVHPANTTTGEGMDATFSVTAAAANGAPLSYQWEKQESGLGAWAALTGETSSTLELVGVTLADDSTDAYRVVISAEGAPSVTSNAATLTVVPVISIDTQPADAEAVAGEATFTVVASIDPATSTLSYQWQSKAPADADFADMVAETSDTLALTGLTVAEDGNQYRVVVSGSDGAADVTSDAATLTVSA